MRWPWVARRALDAVAAERDRLLATTVPSASYEAVCSERDHLRAEIAKLIDHLTRMERWEKGLPETVRPEKPPLPPMPDDLMRHYNGFGDQRIRRQMIKEAYLRNQRGVSWAVIMEEQGVGKDDA